jgi:hypothetical protein
MEARSAVSWEAQGDRAPDSSQQVRAIMAAPPQMRDFIDDTRTRPSGRHRRNA